MKTKSKKNITTWGFIMSALGAAVGLGGIWGFPTQMNKHGGIHLIIATQRPSIDIITLVSSKITFLQELLLK